ncbi:MAG: LLM class F420-dependent oxidoreductase [Candidatus Rokubacteria bacterium]|nr:LLM class F420-dependent oxidoreductase [Candidatus Rokubacteria bacterium]
MEFGCHLPSFGPIATRHNVLTFAKRIEALGYDSLWASDHVILPYAIRSRYPYSETGQFPLPANANFLEPLTTLALAAGVTERVKLGTTILVLPHRHPVLAAKMLANLDHLSAGRVILGVGVGWMEEEITLLGAPYRERGAWSDEAIRIMRTCWSQERASYAGRFFRFDEIGCFPQPVRKSIPIWVGGHTSRALRRVAELGDGWHAAFPAPDKLASDLALLRDECRKVGRRFEDLAITLRVGVSIRSEKKPAERRPMTGMPEEIIGDIRRYRALGVTTLLLESRQRDLDDMLQIHETFAGEIIPAV